MAVAFQSIGTRTDASTGTSTSAAIQAGVVAGDFLFAVINKSRIGAMSETSASGWKSIIQSNQTGLSVAIYWKISNGADTAPNFTWSANSATTAFILRFNGTSATGLGTHGTVGAATTNPHTSASFNSTAANSLAVAIDSQATATQQVRLHRGGPPLRYQTQHRPFRMLYGRSS
jgi:hypothetical protein